MNSSPSRHPIVANALTSCFLISCCRLLTLWTQQFHVQQLSMYLVLVDIDVLEQLGMSLASDELNLIVGQPIESQKCQLV